MGDHAEHGQEGVFEIIWRQHDRRDWMADVRETRTNQRRLVYSTEELRAFLHASIGWVEPRAEEP